MLFALLSACSLSLAGATTVYAHAHAIMTRQQSYPGDAIMCSNNTITPNHLEPKFVLDKCYIQSPGTGAPSAIIYTSEHGVILTHTWYFDCTQGPCNPRCEDTPPKSEWTKVPLGIASCSPQKRSVPHKGNVIADWCEGNDTVAASACVFAALRTPLGKSACPHADPDHGSTVKEVCGSCGCFNAGSTDLSQD